MALPGTDPSIGVSQSRMLTLCSCQVSFIVIFCRSSSVNCELLVSFDMHDDPFASGSLPLDNLFDSCLLKCRFRSGTRALAPSATGGCMPTRDALRGTPSSSAALQVRLVAVARCGRARVAVRGVEILLGARGEKGVVEGGEELLGDRMTLAPGFVTHELEHQVLARSGVGLDTRHPHKAGRRLRCKNTRSVQGAKLDGWTTCGSFVYCLKQTRLRNCMFKIVKRRVLIASPMVLGAPRWLERRRALRRRRATAKLPSEPPEVTQSHPLALKQSAEAPLPI
eukprot:4013364-Pleurochrysis_carterae.AAC.2